jgi:phosphosulfolactate synthase
MPDFLATPPRSPKPRERGLTHVLDSGLGLAALDDALAGAAHLVDVVKLGWGTAYVDPRAPEKVARLRQHGIRVSLGGTLFEAAVLLDGVEGLCDWAESIGVEILEVSSGTLDIEQSRKLRFIGDLARRFTVLSEVGSKDVDIVMAPYRWVDIIRRELDAGAWKVIAEGRESGTAGLYRRDGEIRHGLVEEIVAAVEPRHVLFEAPRMAQQAWFIKTLGTEVNLGNIAWSDVISLETLRLGLRGDTLLAVHGRRPPEP